MVGGGGGKFTPSLKSSKNMVLSYNLHKKVGNQKKIPKKLKKKIRLKCLITLALFLQKITKLGADFTILWLIIPKSYHGGW